MAILDGKAVSQKILSQLKQQVDGISGTKPKLDIILVGDNPASVQYVNMKQKRAQAIGIRVQVHQFAPTTSQSELEVLINELNADPLVTGIMIQLPLPGHLFAPPILNLIDPDKDTDGLTATNLGRLFQQHPAAIPAATAAGVMRLLEEYEIALSGKNAVIIGRSPEVGLPLLALLQAQNATVTLCHSQTKNLPSLAQSADILISAVGKPRIVDQAFVKRGVVVVDVGLGPDPSTGKLAGDVDFNAVAPLASYITPVPGGVGPMTIASLLSNVVTIRQRRNS